MKKVIIGIIVLLVGIVIIIGGLTFYKGDNPDTKLFWRFVDAGIEESINAPKTKVTLNINDKEQEIGEYIGSCTEIDGSSWTLLENEKAGVICYWAGGGKEIGVFEENNKLIIKTGDLEEGSEETPGFRGNFVEFSEVK